MRVTHHPEIQAEPRRDIKPLTSLRIFPAMALVLLHAADYFPCWRGLGNYYNAGQAITFFFVLSGFILTQNYFYLSNVNGALKFYIARFSRIWPAHATSLLLLIMLIPEIFTPKGDKLPVFFSNLFMTHSWIPSWPVFFSFNAPSWSNATEMFFYLSFPFLLWSMRRRWFFPILITGSVASAFIFACRLAHLPEFDPSKISYQWALYINPLTRIFDFTVGMSAALLWRNYLSKIEINKYLGTILEFGILAGVCALNVYSTALHNACLPWAGEAAAYWIKNIGPSVIGFAMLIITFACERGYLSRLFSSSFLVLLGELSFGVYMLHGVLITYLGVNFPQETSSNTCLLFLATVFIGAHLMSEIIEKPLRKRLIGAGAKLLNKETARKPDSSVSSRVAGIAQSLQSPALSIKKGLLIATELLLLVGIIYNGLPTIHRISETEAIAQQNNAVLKNTVLSGGLDCSSVTVNKQEKTTLPLHLIWKAGQDQNVNYTVTAVALDKNNATISSMRYKMDARCQRVRAGDYWSEDIMLEVPDSAQVKSVTIAVKTKKGRQLLQSLNTPPSVNYSLAAKL